MDEISHDAARAARDLRVVLGRRAPACAWSTTPAPDAVADERAEAAWRSRATASASDLATAEGVRPQSVATILAALDGHGLRGTLPGPARRQAAAVRLTSAGRERAGGRPPCPRGMARPAFQDLFTPDERATVLDALTLLDRLTLERPAT